MQERARGFPYSNIKLSEVTPALLCICDVLAQRYYRETGKQESQQSHDRAQSQLRLRSAVQFYSICGSIFMIMPHILCMQTKMQIKQLRERARERAKKFHYRPHTFDTDFAFDAFALTLDAKLRRLRKVSGKDSFT